MLVTSLDLAADRIAVVAAGPDGVWAVETPRLPIEATGCGDAVAALFLGWLLKGKPVPEALAQRSPRSTVSIEATMRVGGGELALVAAQDELVSPSRSVSSAATIEGLDKMETPDKDRRHHRRRQRHRPRLGARAARGGLDGGAGRPPPRDARGDRRTRRKAPPPRTLVGADRRLRPGLDRRAVRRGQSRPMAASTCCSTMPGPAPAASRSRI